MTEPISEEIQVVFLPALIPALEAWLHSRGLYLFKMPIEDDLPTYGIGFND
jgi:hypothetical protein